MPYDYINYYISKVYDAFVAVRPVNNAFPLFSNGSYQNPYDLSSTDYICHQEYTNNITQDGNIYHTIQYHYTLLQYKGTININYY